MLRMTTERTDRNINCVIEILNEETFQIGTTIVKKETILINGYKSLSTTLHTSSSSNFDLFYDNDLVEKGIVLETSGLLINQAETSASLGRDAGFKPDSIFKESDTNKIAIPGNHFGWQTGAFIIADGNIVLIKNDKESLTGEFDVMTFEDKWSSVHISIKNGKLELDDEKKLQKVHIGFSAPLILKGGEVVDTRSLLADPRILADSRNVIDFGNGQILSSDLAQMIRKVIPTTKLGIDRLVRGDTVVQRLKTPLNNEEFLKIKNLIKENNLQEFLQIDMSSSGHQRFIVLKDLPLQKMPFMSYGYTNEGSLIAVAIDGRQEGSRGVTIQELAGIMKQKGAVTAALMVGGADVSVVSKTNLNVEILNSPSTVDNRSQKRVLRNIPSVMTIA